ncbi:hypothetical protein A2U01_0065917 [Trifolium medium]|uniref:Secreted protein n=1 Tax=Trifolium medium TaxID=97028 RepID=A0A392S775_9FABA|nr:hypothetical protein [Trifolium medium]
MFCATICCWNWIFCVAICLTRSSKEGPKVATAAGGVFWAGWGSGNCNCRAVGLPYRRSGWFLQLGLYLFVDKSGILYLF